MTWTKWFVPILGAAITLTGCALNPTNPSQDDPKLRPFITVAPSGVEVVCTWNNWNGHNGDEWECQPINRKDTDR